MPGKGWLEVQLLAVGSASLAVQLENDNSKQALGRYIREHYLMHLDTAMRQMAQLEKQNKYDWKLRHPTIPFGDAQKRVDNVADLTIWKLSQKLHAAVLGIPTCAARRLMSRGDARRLPLRSSRTTRARGEEKAARCRRWGTLIPLAWWQMRRQRCVSSFP